MSYAMFLPEYNEMLTPFDVRQVLKVGRNYVYNILKSGELKSDMIAGKYRIPKIYLWEFLYPGRDFSNYDNPTDNTVEDTNDIKKDE